MLAISSFLSSENKSQNDELHHHGDGDDEQWDYQLMDTQEQEDVEEHHVEGKVDSMTATEAREVLPSGWSAKGEIAGKEVVADEADQIARDVGHVGTGIEEQHIVDGIVYGRRQTAVQGKAQKLPAALVVP